MRVFSLSSGPAVFDAEYLVDVPLHISVHCENSRRFDTIPLPHMGMWSVPQPLGDVHNHACRRRTHFWSSQHGCQLRHGLFWICESYVAIVVPSMTFFPLLCFLLLNVRIGRLR